MKTSKIILAILFLTGLLASCLEDDSSLTYKLVNPISIELGGESTNYTVLAYDTLNIKPIVYKEGVNDSDLSFRWTISGKFMPPTLVDTMMTLKMWVNLQPQNTAYDLLYEVIDRTTGIVQEQTFTVKVETPFGPGLIFSETEDGQVSDISLIRGYNFSKNFKKDQTTVMRNLFSLINGRKIEGVGTAVLSTSYGQFGRWLTVGTNASIERLDPYDYSYLDGNGDCFMIDPKNYNVSSLNFARYTGKIEICVIEGKVYTHYVYTEAIHKYSHYLFTSDMSDYSVSLSTQPTWAYALCFDEMNGRFLEIHDRDYLRVINSSKLKPGAPFDPNKLQNFTCRAMFSGKDKVGHNILQEKDPETGLPKPNGKIYCYDTKQVSYNTDKELENGMPLKIIDMNDFPEIQKALFFTGTDNRDFIYYATPQKIYTFDLLMGKVNADYIIPSSEDEETFMASDEEITSMAVWSGDGNVNYTDNNGQMRTTASKNSMLVITTYSPSLNEGFVRTLPIAIFSGKIEQNKEYHGFFRGFGKITATSPQTE